MTGLDSTKLLKIFNLADKDRSGTLTETELKPIVRAVLQSDADVNPATIRKFMELMDKDKNDTITIDEFLEGAQKFTWNKDVLSNLLTSYDTMQHPRQLDGVEINFSEVNMVTKLGEGTYGIVYKGEWRGSPVAVKVLKTQNMNDTVLEEFKKELLLLGRLRHPNVVLLMGASTISPNLCFVTEFLSGGSVYDALRSKQLKMDMVLFRKLARDIAQGMNYLHLSNVIHRDLKSMNLLLDAHNNIKICDFGLSRLKTTEPDTMTKAVGSPVWMAPELLLRKDYDEKVDIYAYGIILWELGTGQLPYLGMETVQIAVGVTTQGLRPPIPSNWPVFLQDLIRTCWHSDPTQRPSFQAILSILDAWN